MDTTYNDAPRTQEYINARQTKKDATQKLRQEAYVQNSNEYGSNAVSNALSSIVDFMDTVSIHASDLTGHFGSEIQKKTIRIPLVHGAVEFNKFLLDCAAGVWQSAKEGINAVNNASVMLGNRLGYTGRFSNIEMRRQSMSARDKQAYYNAFSDASWYERFAHEGIGGVIDHKFAYKAENPDRNNNRGLYTKFEQLNQRFLGSMSGIKDIEQARQMRADVPMSSTPTHPALTPERKRVYNAVGVATGIGALLLGNPFGVAAVAGFGTHIAAKSIDQAFLAVQQRYATNEEAARHSRGDDFTSHISNLFKKIAKPFDMLQRLITQAQEQNEAEKAKTEAKARHMQQTTADMGNPEQTVQTTANVVNPEPVTTVTPVAQARPMQAPPVAVQTVQNISDNQQINAQRAQAINQRVPNITIPNQVSSVSATQRAATKLSTLGTQLANLQSQRAACVDNQKNQYSICQYIEDKYNNAKDAYKAEEATENGVSSETKAALHKYLQLSNSAHQDLIDITQQATDISAQINAVSYQQRRLTDAVDLHLSDAELNELCDKLDEMAIPTIDEQVEQVEQVDPAQGQLFDPDAPDFGLSPVPDVQTVTTENLEATNDNTEQTDVAETEQTTVTETVAPDTAETNNAQVPENPDQSSAETANTDNQTTDADNNQSKVDLAAKLAATEAALAAAKTELASAHSVNATLTQQLAVSETAKNETTRQLKQMADQYANIQRDNETLANQLQEFQAANEAAQQQIAQLTENIRQGAIDAQQNQQNITPTYVSQPAPVAPVAPSAPAPTTYSESESLFPPGSVEAQNQNPTPVPSDSEKFDDPQFIKDNGIPKENDPLAALDNPFDS